MLMSVLTISLNATFETCMVQGVAHTTRDGLTFALDNTPSMKMRFLL